ncbi:MAG TPA: glycosyltransferase [Patescibacteria group bacterium]|nr:glycosyltransferase [Patescibacteria group bacterium]
MRGIHLAIVIKNIDGGTGTFLRQMVKIGKPIDKISVLALEEPTYIPLKKPGVIYCRHKNNKDEPNGLLPVLTILTKEFSFLAKELKKTKPDVILSIDTHCNMLVCLIKLIVNPKSRLILTIHNNISGVFKYKQHLFPIWLIRFSGHLLFKLSSCMVGVSKGVTGNIIDNFHPTVPVHTIYYGLDPKPIKKLIKQRLSLSETRLFSPKTPSIVTVSRLAGQKDVRTLIWASIKLFKRGVDHNLVIVGDGKEKNDFIKLIKKFKLSKKIHILGWKKNIYPYLKRSDVFVLSTHYEGFPYVLLEAMVVGLPIVSTNVDFGPKEMLANGKYGLLSAADDPDDLSDKIELLINKPDIRSRLYLKSRERIKDFTEEKMLQKYRNLIQKNSQR